MAIQIDAAINPGNSGGPAIMGDKVAGVAFQNLSGAENIGLVSLQEHFFLTIPFFEEFAWSPYFVKKLYIASILIDVSVFGMDLQLVNMVKWLKKKTYWPYFCTAYNTFMTW